MHAATGIAEFDWIFIKFKTEQCQWCTLFFGQIEGLFILQKLFFQFEKFSARENYNEYRSDFFFPLLESSIVCSSIIPFFFFLLFFIWNTPFIYNSFRLCLSLSTTLSLSSPFTIKF